MKKFENEFKDRIFNIGKATDKDVAIFDLIDLFNDAFDNIVKRIDDLESKISSLDEILHKEKSSVSSDNTDDAEKSKTTRTKK